MSDLPIQEILPSLVAHLSAQTNAVVVAPPGAGKSTAFPAALLARAVLPPGKIILLQPRRVAVRATAHRLAELSGQRIGQTVGYQMRGEGKQSAQTQLLVVTQGIFRRMILEDPELNGISAVLFDEYHERSIDTDLCLALSLDVQSNLRPDLRLVLMSATLQAEAVLAQLPSFTLFESEGRSYPVETIYAPPAPRQRLEQQVVSAAARAVLEEEGDILCFLPGYGEIRRASKALMTRFEAREDIAIHQLYGAQNFKDQKAALAPSDAGMRKIIVATDIAETSLTLPGVRSVIDAGLNRVPVYTPGLGLTRLTTIKAAKSNIDQRRGRAGRVAPGTCYRLWPQQQTKALPAAQQPEILGADLCDLVLACADWGAADMAEFSWVTPPPEKQIDLAKRYLQSAHMLDAQGHITALGRAAARLPLPADLAGMLLEAAAAGQAFEAACLCAALTDISLQRREDDLASVCRQVAKGKSTMFENARRLAKGWAERADALAQSLNLTAQPHPLAIRLARARPHLVAMARSGEAGRFKLFSGRGALVEDTSQLASASFLVIGDARLAGSDARISTAFPVTRDALLEGMADRMETHSALALDARTTKVFERTTLRLGAIALNRQEDLASPGIDTAAVLEAHIQNVGLGNLDWPFWFEGLQTRVAFARKAGAENLPDLSFEALWVCRAQWLLPLLLEVNQLSALSPQARAQAAEAMIDYPARQQLDAAAPVQFALPTGQSVKIDYGHPSAPYVEAKLQGFFGLKTHPTIGKRALPLSVGLLSPAGRPLQMTQDLPGFWAGSYQDVRRDMRGRYPKHPWPEDPSTATATLRAKPRS